MKKFSIIFSVIFFLGSLVFYWSAVGLLKEAQEASERAETLFGRAEKTFQAAEKNSQTAVQTSEKAVQMADMVTDRLVFPGRPTFNAETIDFEPDQAYRILLHRDLNCPLEHISVVQGWDGQTFLSSRPQVRSLVPGAYVVGKFATNEFGQSALTDLSEVSPKQAREIMYQWVLKKAEGLKGNDAWSATLKKGETEDAIR